MLHLRSFTGFQTFFTFSFVFSILLSQLRSCWMADMCPSSPSSTGSKVHPPKSPGRTDIVQVEDPKLECAVHQVSITEDEEEGKRVDVLENCREPWQIGADLYTGSFLKDPKVNSLFFPLNPIFFRQY